MNTELDRKRGARAALIVLAALLLAAAPFLWAAFPDREAPPEQSAAPIPAQSPAAAESARPEAVETARPAASAEPEPTPAPGQAPEPEELLKLYRKAGLAARPEIEEGLAALRAENPSWGELWTGIFERMFYVNQNDEIPETVPSGLPEDDSLCFVVFGFGLHTDGTMRTELIERCEAALACAEAYPNAYLALTGGPTAAENRGVTEASAMAGWLKRHGVAEERLILEPRSLLTTDNAVYLSAILTEQYPQIRSLVIVSSSYHVPMCRLLMEETALLEAYERGSAPYEVAAVMGVYVDAHGDWTTPALLSDYVRSVASRMLNR